MYTLESLTTETLIRLGDRKARIWPRSLVKRYLIEGYNQLCLLARPLWDVTIFEDKPPAANEDFTFESEFGAHLEKVPGEARAAHYPGGVHEGTANYEHEFEKDFLKTNGKGPANFNHHFEAPYATAYPAAVSQMPSTMIQVERVAWSGRKVPVMSSNGMEWGLDAQFETVRGDVEAYLMDKEGMYGLRRYRVPSGNGTYFTYQGRWGTIRKVGETTSSTLLPFPRLGFFARMVSTHVIHPPDVGISLSWSFSFANLVQVVTGALTTLSAFAGAILSPSRGVIRRIPGFHPSGGTRGIIRRIILDHRNTRAEFHRRGVDPSTHSEFELPDFYMRYVRHFAMARCFNHDGDGQDKRMSKLFQKMFMKGVERIVKRCSTVQAAKFNTLGQGSTPSNGRPPLARLPWNYPSPDRRRRRW